MRGTKKAAMIAACIVGVLLLAGVGLFVGATWDTMPEEARQEVQPSPALLEKVVQGPSPGKSSGFLPRSLTAIWPIWGSSPTMKLLREVRLSAQEEQVELWLPVTWNGLHITAYCRGEIAFQEDTLTFRLLEAKAGLLSLPVSTVLSLAEPRLPDSLQRTGEDTLSLGTPRFSLEEYGVQVSVGLQEAYIEGGAFVLRTDSLSHALGTVFAGGLGLFALLKRQIQKKS